ncbi:MAG: ABC-F family ATP-binding cassette domain-containing protein, partial [Myxococcota bacterium]|nr:ABC-F family ATP-binding cassette domain-containing protein [Myxococcota bacterium]
HQELLSDYEEAIIDGDAERMSELQDRLDVVGWDLGHNIDSMLERVGAPPATAKNTNLSGGEKRRVALARTLLSNADLLILDEPTNHLDVETIEWLEAFLKGYRGGVLLVTHDRYMLESVATHIVEIENGLTYRYTGGYSDYLEERTERQFRLEQAEDRRLKILAKELAWAARSPSARSTKQKARLQRIDGLKNKIWSAQEELKLRFMTLDNFGANLIEARDLAFGYDEPLFARLDFSIAPNTRLGIIGPNGAGKSTLMKIIAKKLKPQKGNISFHSRCKIGMIDQKRSGLKLNETVWEAVGGGNDHVFVNEQPVHVASFLRRFLFSREMLEQRVDGLSGGERARLLLAKLMLNGANLILLDEPTNDLDFLTLRSLEESLLSFGGAVVVISHDRAFLDRVCTSVLSFEAGGRVVEYADRQQALAARRKSDPPTETAPKKRKTVEKSVKKGLSFKERKELAALPDEIERLEQQQEELIERLNDPSSYKDSEFDVKRSAQMLQEIEDTVARLYERWEALSELDL